MYNSRNLFAWVYSLNSSLQAYARLWYRLIASVRPGHTTYNWSRDTYFQIYCAAQGDPDLHLRIQNSSPQLLHTWGHSTKYCNGTAQQRRGPFFYSRWYTIVDLPISLRPRRTAFSLRPSLPFFTHGPLPRIMDIAVTFRIHCGMHRHVFYFGIHA